MLYSIGEVFLFIAKDLFWPFVYLCVSWFCVLYTFCKVSKLRSCLESKSNKKN